MELIENVVFEGERVKLDGRQFVGCTFRKCTLVIAGTDQFSLQRSRMEGVSFEFEGMAARLVNWLKQLRAQGMDVLAG